MNPYEPTHRPQAFHDTWTRADFYIPPPPPPPKEPKSHTWLVTLIVAAAVLLFVGGSVGYYREFVAVQPPSRLTPTPATNTPTPTPTPNAAYTAADIMQDFNTAGIRPKFVEYGRTIWSWTADTYSVAAPSTSSVDFTDDSGCTGPCSPRDIGVWVYSDATTAQQAYNEVSNDEAHQGDIPMMGKPVEYVRGRCLLLGADANSIYWQVVTQYCV